MNASPTFDEALAVLDRLVAALTAHRDATPEEAAAIPPHMRHDPGDAGRAIAALKLLVAEPNGFERGLGLIGNWRQRARKAALSVAICALPTTTSGEAWPRAVEAHQRLVRHPRDPLTAAVLDANGGRRPSRASLYRIFSSGGGFENPPVRLERHEVIDG